MQQQSGGPAGGGGGGGIKERFYAHRDAKYANGANGAANGKQPTRASCSSSSPAASSTAGGCNGSQHSNRFDLWEHPQQTRTLGGEPLDWTNCCVFNLYRGRGHVVQAPPPWPVQCTAAHQAAASHGPLATGHFNTEGPHFLDWKALSERGAHSMIAVPCEYCGQVVGVLSLASSQVDLFAGAAMQELVGKAAALLAPYLLALEHSTRRSEMEKLITEIITPIASNLAVQKQSQLAKLGVYVADDESYNNALGLQTRGVPLANPTGNLQAPAAAASSRKPLPAARPRPRRNKFEQQSDSSSSAQRSGRVAHDRGGRRPSLDGSDVNSVCANGDASNGPNTKRTQSG